MKIIILPSAREDLAEGFRFYEQQEEGLGSYFLESLFSDIDSLRLYAGIHRKVFGSHRCFPNASLTPSITSNNLRRFVLRRFWIADGILGTTAGGCGE